MDGPSTPASSLPKFPILTPLFLYLPFFLLSPNGCKAKQYPGLKSFSLSFSFDFFSSCNFTNVCLYETACVRVGYVCCALCPCFHPSFPPPPPLIAPIAPPVSLTKPRCKRPARLWERLRQTEGSQGGGSSPPHCLSLHFQTQNLHILHLLES